MRIILQFFLITILFVSCAKDGKNIYIEGKIVNPVTGQPIEGIRLVLHKKISDLGSGSSSVIKDEAYSDINGNFVLSHNGSLFNNYIVLVEYPNQGYHLVGWKDENGQVIGEYQLEVKKGDLMNVTLNLVPYGYVRTWFHNVNCYNANDSIVVSRINEYIYYTPGHFSNVGCQNLEQLSFMKRPMGKIYIYYTVYRDNSGPINGIDTIFVGDGDSTTYLLEY